MLTVRGVFMTGGTAARTAPFLVFGHETPIITMPLARTAASVAIAPQYLMGASPDGWGGGAPSPPYYNNNGQQHQGLDLSALMRHEGIVGGGGVGACVSVTHSLGPYGMYQAGTLDPSALNVLRRVCLASPSDSIHTNMRELFDQDTLAVLQQGSHSRQAALVKLADGFAIVAPTHNNRVLGVLKDSYLCMRRGEDPSDAPVLGPNGARSAFYSIANPPGEDHSVKHFTMVYHDGVCEAGQISRFAPANHAIAMIAAAIPLSVPRVIYQAASLGTLMGECVSGEGAHLLKTTFLKLVQSSGGCDGTGVYNVPIVTSGQIARLLQLNTPQGCIALTRCADGMVGYRQREDGLKAFIFVATSPDFLSGTPSLDGDIQVYKINYSCAKSTAPRIFICPVSVPVIIIIIIIIIAVVVIFSFGAGMIYDI
jgi:hypothetical protein